MGPNPLSMVYSKLWCKTSISYPVLQKIKESRKSTEIYTSQSILVTPTIQKMQGSKFNQPYCLLFGCNNQFIYSLFLKFTFLTKISINNNLYTILFLLLIRKQTVFHLFRHISSTPHKKNVVINILMHYGRH